VWQFSSAGWHFGVYSNLAINRKVSEMMDISQIAVILAPLVPYLIKGGLKAAKAAAEKLGEKVTDETWNGLKAWWEKSHKKPGKKLDALDEAAQDAAQVPDDSDTQAALRQQIKKFLAENPDLLKEAENIVGQIVNISYNSAVSLSAKGDIKGIFAIGGGQINTTVNNFISSTPGEDPEKLKEQIKTYLRWAEEYFGIIELRGIEQGERQVIQLELDKVYVPLQAEYQPEQEEMSLEGPGATDRRNPGRIISHRQNRSIQLNQILKLGTRLIITGGPGCGKTTVLQHIIWTLAKTWMEGSNFAGKKLGLHAPYPLPLYVPLNLYAIHVRNCVKMPAKQRTLAAFISDYLIRNQTSLEINPNFFSYLLREEHNIILLLDGLDEVPTEEERIQVREDIERLVSGKKNLRVVVTSRTAAYKGKATLGHGFQHVHVLPLEEKHIASLIHKAYEARFPNSSARAKKEAAALLENIKKLETERRGRQGQDVEPLVDSPLMVRMLLIVAANNRVLPNQRADLYDKTVVAMLRPENILDEEVAREIGERVGGGLSVHREMLQHLAFHMHQRGQEQGKEVDEDTVRKILGTEAAYAPHIEDLIKLTRARGTVLDFRGGMYRFLHLSFQEFLAARYLAENLRDLEKIARFLENGPILDSWWREPALLLCGYLDLNASTQAGGFLLRLANSDKNAATRDSLPVDKQIASAELAGAALLECQSQLPELADQLAKRLVELIGEHASSKPQVRASAGDTLARLGDPRFDENLWCFPKEPLLGFKHIPAGKFVMGTKPGDVANLVGKYGGDKTWYEDETPQNAMDLPDTGWQNTRSRWASLNLLWETQTTNQQMPNACLTFPTIQRST
jgi:NACHT domain